MILHIPVQNKMDGQVRVAARIETESAIPNLPADLWYQFPERYEGYLSARAEGFAATALLTAMYCGENLDIRAPISPKFAYNLLEYRNIFHGWLPKIFHMVDVRYEKVEIEAGEGKAKGVASAFSGGVDSFYTLWSHLAENQPIVEARITHGLFLHGYDLRLDEAAPYQAIARKYTDLFHKYGLELILASTNAYQFAEFRIDWALFNGAPLIGAALLMSPLLQRFYIPGWTRYNDITPQGTSPLTDHLLSTDHLDIIHHGASASRFEKISLLIDWPVTYDLLRVCSNKQQSAELKNCSSCHKCYRTMVSLSILNALPKYVTFDPKLSLRDYFHWGIQTHMDIGMARDNRNRALKVGKIGLGLRVELAILINSAVKMAVRTMKFFIPRKVLYRLKRNIFKPESDQAGIQS